jgi:ABC-type branched-subunit amino acid transport system permease subunit
MTENPYSATTTSSRAIPESEFAQMSLLPIARSVFLAWEKLRIVYVIILAFITILLAGATGIFNLALVRLIVLGAVVANVAYFAGPTIETYVRWLGYNRNWPRWVMFIGGTLLSIILEIVLLATELLRDQP